jgi:Rrf2 family protein
VIGLTKKTDYALLALSHLASVSGNEAVRAREIAERYEIPVELLAKVLQRLARSGVLTSSPGPSGGYSLARPAGDITVGSVLEAVEGAPALAHCLRSDPTDCDQVTRCTIRGPLARINARVLRMLDAIPVSELASGEPRVQSGKWKGEGAAVLRWVPSEYDDRHD